MIDTKPYLDEIRLLLVDTLKAYPCNASHNALDRLYSVESLDDAFPEIARLGREKLKKDSYVWARNARYKRKMNIVDEMRLAMYEIPNRMFEDEKLLTGQKAVDGQSSAIVRPAAQIAAVVASRSMFEWMKIDDEERDFWSGVISFVHGCERVRHEG